MKIVAVIPARYASSRFPGKPLADICGKPMIWWVYQQAKKVEEFTQVLVATDDSRIETVCMELGMEVMMISERHKTGTDRVGEVARRIPADLYVNIQGDEPMIEPDTIRQAILPFQEGRGISVSNLMTRISDPVDVVNFTIPKVITNQEGIAVYLTLSCAPYPKGSIDYNYYKQVCVYGFTPEALAFFCDSLRGKVEAIEDIELLRFVENGYKVQFVAVDSETIAVDTQNDLQKVNMIMKKKWGRRCRFRFWIVPCGTAGM